ncbi:MAG TPA: ATP-dependent helicase, partial [Spirochaetota bacterium]|nr:ATP-dependent helicase [Spirochaetota bacterium]
FTYKVDYNKLLEGSEYVHTLSTDIIEILHNRASEQRKNSGGGDSAEVLVEFSVPFLRKCSEELLESRLKTASPEEYHKALIYLNSIGSIRLDKGFFILYSPLTITRTEKNGRRQFSEKEFEILQKFYDQKVEQIHIMQRYALLMQENIDNARLFTSDYFTLTHEGFIDKYYGTDDEKKQITKPIPQETFVKIFGQLSPEQLGIVNDVKNRRVLVAAGPGSGKTRVLVHKVGAILATEDVKPEQFLMLTFSRSAVMEFRSRLQELIGDVARYVDIFTYHSFCFNIRGVAPVEDEFDRVIETTIAEIDEGRLDVTRLKNKSILVIDEFQDLNSQEYRLIQKLIGISGELRVLAVGDDDQNIFGFRKASNEYMNRFVEEGAEKYELLTNFRSVSNIVQFSNRLRKNIRGRIKQGDLVAKSNETGEIGIYNFRCSELIIPLIKRIVESGEYSDTAILTPKNEDVSMIDACLIHEGIPAFQGSSEIDFKIKDMEEISSFTDRLRDAAPEREIPPDVWMELRIGTEKTYGESKHLDQALAIIDRFRDTYTHLFFREWINYILEMHINDFTASGRGITVSTIHRAKGREYDTVYLMVPDYKFTDDENMRLLYVAVTRAKSNLYIFSNSDFFNSMADENAFITDDDFIYSGPGHVSVNLNYNKVNLGFFKNDRVVKTVEGVHSGNPLEYKESDHTFYTEDRHACMMSKAGREELDSWLNRGFRVKEAEAEYVVNWYCRDDKKTYPVVLPKVSLEKEGEG